MYITIETEMTKSKNKWRAQTIKRGRMEGTNKRG